jgi:hypothetical protein
MSHASEDAIRVSKSLTKRRGARLIQPRERSTIQRSGKTTKPLIFLSVRLTTVVWNPARFEGGALGLIAVVSLSTKASFTQGLFADTDSIEQSW